ncbi:hypothetical protein D3C73_1445080 [compost metagenome]
MDFPAPFSPQIAWISPERTVIETSDSALTPGNSLVMLRISKMGPDTTGNVAVVLTDLPRAFAVIFHVTVHIGLYGLTSDRAVSSP